MNSITPPRSNVVETSPNSPSPSQNSDDFKAQIAPHPGNRQFISKEPASDLSTEISSDSEVTSLSRQPSVSRATNPRRQAIDAEVALYVDDMGEPSRSGLLELDFQERTAEFPQKQKSLYYTAKSNAKPAIFISTTLDKDFPSQNRKDNHTNLCTLAHGLGCEKPTAPIDQSIQKYLELYLDDLANSGEPPPYLMACISCPTEIITSENNIKTIALLDKSEHPPTLSHLVKMIQFAPHLVNIPKLLLLHLARESPLLGGPTKEQIATMDDSEKEKLKVQIEETEGEFQEAYSASLPPPHDMSDIQIYIYITPEDFNPQAYTNTLCKTISKYAHMPDFHWSRLLTLVNAEMRPPSWPPHFPALIDMTSSMSKLAHFYPPPKEPSEPISTDLA